MWHGRSFNVHLLNITNFAYSSFLFYKTKETNETLQTIIEAYPKSLTDSGGKSGDEIVMELIDDIAVKLMKFIDCDEAHSTIMQMDNKGRIPSLSTVLLQEIERFNKLLDVIHNSLNELRKAIKGIVVMSTELEGVYISFMNNNVTYTTYYILYIIISQKQFV